VSIYDDDECLNCEIRASPTSISSAREAGLRYLFHADRAGGGRDLKLNISSFSGRAMVMSRWSKNVLIVLVFD